MPRKPLDLATIRRVKGELAELARTHPQAFSPDRLGADTEEIAATIEPHLKADPKEAARERQRRYRERQKAARVESDVPPRRGRAPGPPGLQVAFRVPAVFVARLDAYSARLDGGDNRSEAVRALVSAGLDAADREALDACAHESARACVDAAGPDWAWDFSPRGMADLPTPADFVEAESAMGRPLTPPERRAFATAYRAEVERLAVSKAPA